MTMGKIVISIMLVVVAIGNAFSQQDYSFIFENYGITKEHSFLGQFRGTWRISMEYITQSESEYASGRAECKLILNNRIAQIENSVLTPTGLQFEYLILLGYNSIRKKFFLLVLDNFTNNHFFAFGTYNSKTNEFVFYGEVDDPEKKKPVPIRYRFFFERENKLIIEKYSAQNNKENLLFRAMYIKLSEE